jgi:adenylate cyclase
MKKAIFLTFIICQLSFIIAQAQQTNLDSLYTVWQDKTQNDSIRTKAYNDYIFYGFCNSNPDSAFILAQTLMSFGEQRKYPTAKARAYQLMGLTMYAKGDFVEALDYGQRSLKINEEVGDKRGSATNLLNLGSIYLAHGNYNNALNNYLQSLKLFEEIGEKKKISLAIGNIGIIYQFQGNSAKALAYYLRSSKICEEIGDKEGIARNMINIAIIYGDQGDNAESMDYLQRSLEIYEEIRDMKVISTILGNIGTIYRNQKDYPKAMEYCQRSLKISQEAGFKMQTAISLVQIGSLYSDQGDYTQALNHFLRSLNISQEIGDKQMSSQAIVCIGLTYYSLANYNKAVDYCKQSLELSEEIGGLDKQKNACSCLYDAYKAMGKGNEALVYLEKMNMLNDSLHAEETGQKLQQMEFAKQMLQDSIAQAETDRLVLEAHQEEMRAEEKTRNLALGAGGFFILLAGGFYSRMRYIRKSRATLQVEKDRSENLLLNILPEEIAQELKIYGKAEARDFDLVSILFTDFKGFTEASAKMSAGDLVSEINFCFEAFDGIMEKYGIEKIKTIGDAYMAAGGLPVPTDDSVKNTVLAALEMQAFISKRKSEMDTADKPAFEMRVGIHTGPVVAGIVGVKKFQYDIWGDTVNTASRIESNGEAGKVNISQATYELLKDDPQFAFESRGKIEAKGKGEMEMWFVQLKNKP